MLKDIVLLVLNVFTGMRCTRVRIHAFWVTHRSCQCHHDWRVLYSACLSLNCLCKGRSFPAVQAILYLADCQDAHFHGSLPRQLPGTLCSRMLEIHIQCASMYSTWRSTYHSQICSLLWLLSDNITFTCILREVLFACSYKKT